MKQRLYENCGYVHGTEASKEMYKKLNVPTKIQESVVSSYSDNNVLAAKARKLTESVEMPDEEKALLVEMAKRLSEAETKPTFKIWRLPVARYDVKNLNGRIYPRKLWENVRDNQRDAWCLLCGLNDHPQDEGKFRDQSVLWHDMEIGDDGVVYGYGSFVGDNGALAQQILEHGGRIGTSSSGYGEVDPMTAIVDPDTFEIDRLADLVLHPSQQTYGDASSPVHNGEFESPVESVPYNYNKEPAMAAVNESVEANSPFIVDTTKAPESAILKRTQMEESEKTTTEQAPVEENKVQEATNSFKELELRKMVESYLNETDHMGSQQERIDHMQTALNILNSGACPDLKEAVEKKIAAERKSLDEKVAKIENTERAFGMTIEQFTEKAAEGAEAQKSLQEAVTNYNALVDTLSKRNSALKEKVARLEKENAALRESRKNDAYCSDAELAKAKRENAAISKKNSILKESVNDLDDVNEQLREAASTILNQRNIYDGKLREAQKIIATGIQTRKRLSEKNNRLAADNKKLTEDVNELKLTNQKLMEAHAGQEERFNQLSEQFENYKAMIKDRYDEKSHMAPSKNARVAAYLQDRTHGGEDIDMYYNRLHEAYGTAIEPFESEIKSCTTLREATNHFMSSIKNRIDENFVKGNDRTDDVPVRGVHDYNHLNEGLGSFDPVSQYNNASVEDRNSNFADLLNRAGAQ